MFWVYTHTHTHTHTHTRQSLCLSELYFVCITDTGLLSCKKRHVFHSQLVSQQPFIIGSLLPSNFLQEAISNLLYSRRNETPQILQSSLTKRVFLFFFPPVIFLTGLTYLFAENGISLFLWIGLQVDPNLLHEVFGVQTIGQVDIEMVRN